jgi:uncharacterized protein (UPF0305 family)
MSDKPMMLCLKYANNLRENLQRIIDTRRVVELRSAAEYIIIIASYLARRERTELLENASTKFKEIIEVINKRKGQCPWKIEDMVQNVMDTMRELKEMMSA